MLATSDACTLLARPEALAQLHTHLDRFWGAVDARRGKETPSGLKLGFTTAVAEIAGNIIRHAGARTFDIELTLLGRGAVEARFSDAGVPFTGDVGGALDADPLAEGGRGLPLAKASLCSFDYRRLRNDTNCWILVQRLPE